jgi:hypothetical protein
MLDVERADDMDAGGEDFLNILVPLGVSAVGNISMGQFVDDHHLRLASDNLVEIHFFYDNAMIFHLPPGDHRQAFDEFGGFRPPMCFDNSNNYVDAIIFEAVCLKQHLICLADTRPITQINFQASPLGLSDHLQKSGGAVFGHIVILL